MNQSKVSFEQRDEAKRKQHRKKGWGRKLDGLAEPLTIQSRLPFLFIPPPPPIPSCFSLLASRWAHLPFNILPPTALHTSYTTPTCASVSISPFFFARSPKRTRPSAPPRIGPSEQPRAQIHTHTRRRTPPPKPTPPDSLQKRIESSEKK